jgi:transcription initiation factor TFIID subunit 15
MKFGFRGGNGNGRGGFRKFTPGFRGGRGFNRGGFRDNQSQRSGNQFSENGSQFSGFRGGFNNNQCKKK